MNAGASLVCKCVPSDLLAKLSELFKAMPHLTLCNNLCVRHGRCHGARGACISMNAGISFVFKCVPSDLLTACIAAEPVAKRSKLFKGMRHSTLGNNLCVRHGRCHGARGACISMSNSQCLRVDLRRSLLLGATVLGRTKLIFPQSNLFLPDLDANPNCARACFRAPRRGRLLTESQPRIADQPSSKSYI